MARNLWQDDTVEWFRRALRESQFADLVLEVLSPLLRAEDTVLDLGCGPGTLSIPLAHRVRRVTALDESDVMIRALTEEAQAAKLDNIAAVHANWLQAKDNLMLHDVVIAANVAPIVRDLDVFLPAVHAIAERWVVIILGVDTGHDKFFARALRELLGLPPKSQRGDYLEQYVGLHKRRIFANVQIIAYDFDQPFEDWAEAVAFHRAHLGIESDLYDARIETFLRDHLPVTDGQPRSPMPKKSAIMWWKPPGASAQ